MYGPVGPVPPMTNAFTAPPSLPSWAKHATGYWPGQFVGAHHLYHLGIVHASLDVHGVSSVAANDLGQSQSGSRREESRMTRPIADQVVVVTGASSGIGRACVRAFAARGARLGLIARSEEALQN